jgi:hypothetical protein
MFAVWVVAKRADWMSKSRRKRATAGPEGVLMDIYTRERGGERGGERERGPLEASRALYSPHGPHHPATSECDAHRWGRWAEGDPW